MRNGSCSPGDYPGDVVHITCDRCGRAGRYGCDRLIERYAAGIALPDLLARSLAKGNRGSPFSYGLRRQERQIEPGGDPLSQGLKKSFDAPAASLYVRLWAFTRRCRFHFPISTPRVVWRNSAAA